MLTAILITGASAEAATPRRRRPRRPKSADPAHAAKVTVLKLARTTGVMVKQLAASEQVSRQTIWRWTRDAARTNRPA